MHVDKVAEAIWRVDRPSEESFSWDECLYRNHYRRMAEAAIDALKLTEEHARYDEPYPQMRWVSAWSEMKVVSDEARDLAARALLQLIGYGPDKQFPHPDAKYREALAVVDALTKAAGHV